MTCLFRGAILAAIAICGFASPVPAADCTGRPSAVRLYVDVENVRNEKGLIAVTLYADESRRFLAKRGSLYVGRVPARASKTRVCIHVPKTGVYALAVYHDEDSNRRLNRNKIGLPNEGFGFSNNPRVFLGMPRFSGVRLSVPRTDVQTMVRLRYR